MRRGIRHALLLLALLAATAMPAHADEYVYTSADTEAALAGASPLARCIVDIETGHTMDPYSLGAENEVGVAQLHPQGKLPEFYAAGYTNPWSPYQSVEYLEGALARGEGPAWAAWWWCA